ncbi:MAG TPA: SIS domain-containing protein [Desulfobacteraceae bacterium]|nr:SIS domain-containing protein [Desulfobacteraceae bacterium]
MSAFFPTRIAFFKPLSQVPKNCLVLFPSLSNTLCCGISALVAFKDKEHSSDSIDLEALEAIVQSIEDCCLSSCLEKGFDLQTNYLDGDQTLGTFFKKVQDLKQDNGIFDIFSNPDREQRLAAMVKRVETILAKEVDLLKETMAKLSGSEVETATKRIELLKDANWCMAKEVLENIDKIRNLAVRHKNPQNSDAIAVFKKINAVLNSIDRLEVRGRDSAGISLVFTFSKENFEDFRNGLIQAGLGDDLKKRTTSTILANNSITIHDTHGEDPGHLVTISLVYKCAAEIGSLGDNVSFLRNQIKNDQLLQVLADFPFSFHTISSHTRWASIGDITEANCHPVDNEPFDKQLEKSGIIHACLNGDIDNYLDLKEAYQERYDSICPDITTDTKIIPLQIEHYLRQGETINEAFRLAVNDFSGSHAISMHSDLAPGKLFFAQKGSGQALFVGMGKDHYIAASELYGLVEETSRFIKLNGEKNGQIMILDQCSRGGLSGLSSFSYDNSPIDLTASDIQTSEITSRDIDRQHYPHYFLKEISEAPVSVEKTLENKWKTDGTTNALITQLDRSVIPDFLEKELQNDTIKRIFFIGQGTAGVAAQGCAGIFSHYLADAGIEIRAMKSSELSGFAMRGEESDTDSMAEDLIVAISQSGTTTDTNKTVDMVRARGARTLAIVNRRDSDLTFKTDGVFYTSSGRDIEMSVASTKAFYSQIAAGALLGLHIAALTKRVSPEFVAGEINELSALPGKMRKTLELKEAINQSATRLAVAKNYWATVGSGSNKTAADEIRIKLSELCYKTISSDFVEDKKHIDLSSEPLILVCAAGTRNSVLGDIVKDTAIFHAHKAAPVVITEQGETRFDTYAADVFKVPAVKEHLAPVLNTLVGHIWGYYAALAINRGSEFMYTARNEIQDLVDEYTNMGHDIYEVVLEKKFREAIAKFYTGFTEKRRNHSFPAALGLDNVSNITLLLKYLSGRLPVSDFETDFAVKGTPSNMLNAFFKNIGEAINIMARPVDAIKHQAKTVTVGTSRIVERYQGIVYDELAHHNFAISQLTNQNVLVLKNLQQIFSGIQGALLYRISGLTLLGEPNSETKIEVVAKTGSLEQETSRVETDHRLKGTKNIIVREGNVYIGKGRKDGRNILVIPILAATSTGPNVIAYILSLHVTFKSQGEVSLLKRIKALGGKYTRIKDLWLESSKIKWDDKLLDLIKIEDLFGDSAEKIVEEIEKIQGYKGEEKA